MNTIRSSRAFPIASEALDKYDYITNELFLSESECDEIIAYGEKQNLAWGSIYSEANEKVTTPGHRVVQVTGLPDDTYGWLYDRLAHDAILLNNQFYKYDIRGLYEDTCFLKYTEFDLYGPGKFDWHRDISGAGIVNRKITLIVQLSAPEDYEGCELVLWDDREVLCEAKKKGTLIAFPSWQSHKITPIVKGTRYSLVTWVTGPPFK
jgi:PKHD-type hydroxylase